MEPEGSLPSSQELSTCTYPEPDHWGFISKKTTIFIVAAVKIANLA
jgi:hypothetical protein